MQNTILNIVHHSTFVMALVQRTCLNNETPLCFFLLCLLGCTKRYKRKNRKVCKIAFGSLTMYGKFGSLSNFECLLLLDSLLS